MMWQEFTELVHELRERRPTWFDFDPDQRAAEHDVQEVEAALGVGLPDDYRRFVQEYGGGDFVFTTVYSCDSSSDLYLLANQPEFIDPSEGVAFSDDGTGIYYLFPVRQGRCLDRVVELDSDLGQRDEHDGETFVDFVARVGLHHGVSAPARGQAPGASP